MLARKTAKRWYAWLYGIVREVRTSSCCTQTVAALPERLQSRNKLDVGVIKYESKRVRPAGCQGQSKRTNVAVFYQTGKGELRFNGAESIAEHRDRTQATYESLVGIKCLANLPQGGSESSGNSTHNMGHCRLERSPRQAQGAKCVAAEDAGQAMNDRPDKEGVELGRGMRGPVGQT